MKGFTVLSFLLSLYNDPNLNLFCPKIANWDTQNEDLPTQVSSSLKKESRAGEGSETRVYYSYSQSSVTQVHTAEDIFLSSM